MIERRRRRRDYLSITLSRDESPLSRCLPVQPLMAGHLIIHLEQEEEEEGGE